MEKVLNQEEIDALFGVARGERASAAASARQATPWDARVSRQLSASQVRSIGQLHEDFARHLTDSLGGYVQASLGVTLVSTEYVGYWDFLERLPDVTYLASFGVLPLETVGVLQMDLALAFPVMDLLLGGEGTGTPPARDITEIEEHILQGVGALVCHELERSWQAIELTFAFQQRQRPEAMQRLIPSEEKVLSLSFEITIPEVRGSLNIAVPAVVSSALLRKLNAEAVYVRRIGSTEAVRRMRLRLLSCPFGVELVLPALAVPLRELLNLAPGSVLALPRALSSPASVRAAGAELFLAQPVRRGGQRAAQILSAQSREPLASNSKDSSEKTR